MFVYKLMLYSIDERKLALIYKTRKALLFTSGQSRSLYLQDIYLYSHWLVWVYMVVLGIQVMKI